MSNSSLGVQCLQEQTSSHAPIHIWNHRLRLFSFKRGIQRTAPYATGGNRVLHKGPMDGIMLAVNFLGFLSTLKLRLLWCGPETFEYRGGQISRLGSPSMIHSRHHAACTHHQQQLPNALKPTANKNNCPVQEPAPIMAFPSRRERLRPVKTV